METLRPSRTFKGLGAQARISQLQDAQQRLVHTGFMTSCVYSTEERNRKRRKQGFYPNFALPQHGLSICQHTFLNFARPQHGLRICQNTSAYVSIRQQGVSEHCGHIQPLDPAACSGVGCGETHTDLCLEYPRRIVSVAVTLALRISPHDPSNLAARVKPCFLSLLLYYSKAQRNSLFITSVTNCHTVLVYSSPTHF